ncbi:MAG: heavy metal translocating P-type ATPase [Rhodobacteraceae bacterium]|nr:heavy metal translocating P-type ATPase [Paracoccaceae bacterium]
MDDFSRRGKAEFPVIGMNCGGCAQKVKRHLEGVDGVERADVSHEAAKAMVMFDAGKTDIAALKAVVTGLDYRVEMPAAETAVFNVYGMSCGKCSGKVAKALGAVDGVIKADISHADGIATLEFDPARTSLEALKTVVIDTGYALTPKGETAESVVEASETKLLESLKMGITGMTCASCSGRVETALKSAAGVAKASVNLAIENATIRFDPKVTSAAELAKVVEDAGYGAKIEGEGRDEEAPLKRERFTLIVSALLTAPLLAQMVSMVLGLGFHLSPWVELALATPVQFLIGSRYYIGAWHALKAKAGNMDMLVAIGTSAAYFYSLWLVVSLGHAAMGLLYFEASTVVITLILAGKYMESRAKRSASSALRQLMGLRPASATILTPEGEVDTAIELVKVGDVALLRPGARVPVDGLIVEGESELDEALITGESMPVHRRVGDEVIAGAINGGGVLKVKTMRVGENTTLAKVARMVESAQVGKAPIQKLVDQISAVFVPMIIAIALLTFGIWQLTGASFETSIVAMISVLVIACPCALGLATPTALVAGTGAGAKAGILIRDIETLERAKSIDTVVFDKTGTLTEGKPSVAELHAFEGNEASLLALGAAVQSGSEHPLGKAIVAEAAARGIAPKGVQAAKATAGEGIEGVLEGEAIRMGRGRFAVAQMDPAQETQALEMREGGRTVVWLSKAGKAIGLVGFTDSVRPEAKQAVAQLHKRGVAAYLMTGDNAETAAKVAAELGIDHVIADMRPEDKAREVKALQAVGKHVAMVGDGVNDAPALAEATLGIAMGGGADVAIETAGFVLMRNDPQLVAAALDVSAKTAQKIRQNLFWAFAYNTVGIPIAALGFLNPAVAGAAMAFSSVFVVSNSLLLKFWKPEAGK